LRKKLHLLELLLVVLNVLVVVRVRDKWLDARKRERVVLGQRLTQLPPPPYSPLPVVQPLSAADYVVIVQKDVLSPDRNPTVVVEVVAPKPMPALPVFYGLMNLPGDSPMAIMTAKSGDLERGVRFGEKVGEFTLVAANRDEVVLDWEGTEIRKKTSELAPKGAASYAPAADSARTVAPAPARQQAAVEAGPGSIDMGKGWRNCQPGDSSPNGTVRDGMKKVLRSMPMGISCHWEPVP
jgi:hypothetical protein